jgi:hypothetical protein
MTKLLKAAARVTDDVVHGFAQMGSFGTIRRQPPRRRSVEEALRGDWVKLGGDMQRSVDKVMRGQGRS